MSNHLSFADLFIRHRQKSSFLNVNVTFESIYNNALAMNPLSNPLIIIKLNPASKDLMNAAFELYGKIMELK